MKNNKLMAFTLAGLATSTAHAQNVLMANPQSLGSQVALRELIQNGVLVPRAEGRNFQLNHGRVKEILEDANHELEARRTMDFLRSLVGPSVEISRVDAIHAALGTQDGTGDF